MPVRLPAGALSRCPTCTALTSRSFSQSVGRLAVGPESPRYIDVPQPPQQTVPDKTRLKGILPVPRDISTNPDTIHLSTKEPQSGRAQQHDRIAWKERMAASRRKNLHEGLFALKSRKQKSDSFMAARASKRQRDRETRLHLPERDDERLTNPTVDASLLKLLERSSLPDPRRHARLAEMRQRCADRDAAREDQRRDALHSLYVNARSFIINEAQLNAEIDDAFGTVDNPKRFGAMGGNSVWDNGSPDTVQDMLNAATGQGGRGALGSSNINLAEALTKTRVQRMAEELTGGIIPNDSV